MGELDHENALESREPRGPDNSQPGPSVPPTVDSIYDELRALAKRRLDNEPIGHTLQATALVHEAYLKLMGPRKLPWQGKAHFFAAAGEAMRQVLVDHARAKRCVKRGKGAVRMSMESLPTLSLSDDSSDTGIDFIALDLAVRRLTEQEPRLGSIVRLRYFAGLSVADTAAALGVSERTVKSDWAFARAWLERELRREAGESESDLSTRE